jgi:hypothetical protein
MIRLRSAVATALSAAVAGLSLADIGQTCFQTYTTTACEFADKMFEECAGPPAYRCNFTILSNESLDKCYAASSGKVECIVPLDPAAHCHVREWACGGPSGCLQTGIVFSRYYIHERASGAACS